MIIKIFITNFVLFIFLINLNLFDTYFYEGIFCLLISSFLCFFLYKKSENLKYVLLLLITSFSINLSFFVLFPVALERSISVNMLREINLEYGESEFNFNQVLEINNSFTNSSEFTQKRIDEQMVSGNIVISESGNYSMSKLSKLTLKLFELVSLIYDIK
tara:strand:- start:10182 stop:10661 length:480 start_codon:yes stop_codon:yes gene_type:complete